MNYLQNYDFNHVAPVSALYDKDISDLVKLGTKVSFQQFYLDRHSVI